MGTWVNKDEWERDPHVLSARRFGKQQYGHQGNGFAPTAYKCRRGKFSDIPRLPNGAYQPVVDVPNMVVWTALFNDGSDAYPSARNKAWSGLVKSVRTGPASLGVAFAEWHQSLGMIGNRALDLYHGYKNLRHGNFRGFLRQFGVKPKRRHRNMISNRVNQASSLWLEYSFGWKPLTQDIYSGFTAIGQPLPGGKCSGSGRQDFRLVTGTSNKMTVVGAAYVKQGADVFVDNPNTFALQQEGLANPLEIAWELVPFSFMVDWVFDVGTCLGSLTDLLGCSVSNPFNTAFNRGKGDARWIYNSVEYHTTGIYSGMNRRLGLSHPLPNLAIRANIGSSLNRAANAVSLLGQILTK